MKLAIENNQNIRWIPFIFFILLFLITQLTWIVILEFEGQVNTISLSTHFSDLLFYISSGFIILIPIIFGLVYDGIKKYENNIWIVTSGVVISTLINGLICYSVFAKEFLYISQLIPYFNLVSTLVYLIYLVPFFTSIRLMAPIEKTPIIVAFLVFVFAAIQALKPFLLNLIHQVDFVILLAGLSILTLVFGVVFHFQQSKLTNSFQSDEIIDENASSGVPSAVITGFLVGVGYIFLVFLFPYMLSFENFEMFGYNHNYIPSFFFIIIAFLALGTARFVQVVEPRPSFVLGLVLFAISIGILLFNQEVPFIIGAGVIGAISFTLLSMSAFPYIYSSGKFKEKGLLTGVFFSIALLIPELFKHFFQ